ncbi:MAG: hypothetical protein MRY81_21285 [Donghicola eburneus]|nr:hypothetical protein [Donghicola eburneus]MCI5042200.1 hypothetical protein [Donghicola eburneus]
MTIQDVAAQLSRLNLGRDIRTIQRWRKSGKIQSIVDHANGDRYLILPNSVDELVTGLLKEQKRHEEHAVTKHPQSSRQDRATPRHDAAANHGTARQAHEAAQNSERHAVATDKASHDTAGAGSDSVAALRDKLEELEKENAMLRGDKMVREQMVIFMRDEFRRTYDDVLVRAERLGALEHEVHSLRSDNDRLRSLLPPAAERSGSGFKPRTVVDDGQGFQEPRNMSS